MASKEEVTPIAPSELIGQVRKGRCFKCRDISPFEIKEANQRLEKKGAIRVTGTCKKVTGEIKNPDGSVTKTYCGTVINTFLGKGGNNKYDN